jgi:membrane protein implicated in regulation of membrane protease activity
MGSYKLFWFVLGLALLILEVATPGVLVFVFFGVGAWVVMLCLVVLPLPPAIQWGAFIAVSVALLVLLRRHLAGLFNKRSAQGRGDSLQEPMVAGSYLGRVVEVVEDVAPGRPGLVELNGTNWRAESAAGVSKGARARILEVRDLTLWVEPLDGSGPAGGPAA